MTLVARISAPASRPRRFAAAVAVISLAISVAVVLGYRRYTTELGRARFEAVARDVTARVAQRFGLYEYGLRGSRGAALAVGFAKLSAAQYGIYARSRDLAHEFPGARGMGIIRRVAPGDEAAFLESARRELGQAFAVRQLTPHDGDRYVIEYVEPMDGNRAAIGLDVASERLRKEAAEASAVSGDATLTGPIRLLQASQSQWGFLLLLPIYVPGAPLESAAERHGALVGWSYAPLIAEEVVGDFVHDECTLALSDARETELGPFLTTPGFEQPAAAQLETHLPIHLFGRTWSAEVRATPAFVAGLNLLSTGLLVSLGACISTLLTALGYVYALGEQRRGEVRAEQARRAAIVAGSQDAVIGETFDGLVTDWNEGAVRLFGYTSEQALGRPTASLILPPDRAHEDSELCDAVARGQLPPTFDATRCRADGTLLDVSVSVSPIIAADGRRLGLSNTIRDVSAGKRAEAQVMALNSSLERLVAEHATALEAARRDLKSILDAVPSLIGYWDRSLEIRFANRAHEAWFGVSAAELPGTSAARLFEPAFGAVLASLEAAWSGAPQTLDLELPGQAGTRHGVMHLVPDSVEGSVRGAYVIVHDDTAARQARDQLAAALIDKDALLSTIYEHAIVSVTDGAGRITDANPHFIQISGYARDELIGSTHAVVNSGTHDRAFWQSMWRTIAAGRSWRGVVCNRNKTGSLYWVDSIIAPLQRPGGRAQRYISIRFDVTATRLAEAELRETHARMTLATDAAGIGIWELDVAAEQLRWDAWMYQLYGQAPRGALVALAAWQSSLLPEDRGRVQTEFAQAFATGRTLDTEFRITRGDGRERHIRAVANVVRVEDGRPLRMIGVNFDVTERKQAELELLATSNLLRNVLEAASEVSLIATDPNLVIKVFNRGAERLLGYRAHELVGRATPIVVHDLAEVQARAAELSALSGEMVEGGGAFIHPLALERPHEWTYIRKDGSRVPVSLVVTAMSGDSGELFGYLGVARDVTHQRHYESTLREATRRAEEANRAKSEFLANMSHEIRTPMNAVIGLSYLLEKTALDSEQVGLLDKIQIASKSLLSLINDVLDLSKIEANELTLEQAPFALPKLLAELSDLFALQARAKGLEFRVLLPATLPARVAGDATRLNQVLSNLLTNAIKFTEQGSVELRVRELTGGAGATLSVRFEVEDTGIGISAEQRARLFAPFAQADASTTRRFGGTGLGLSIVKRLTQLMGGTLGLDSAPNAGSTFWVELPLVITEADTEPSQPAPEQTESISGVRVLVVDDSDINLFVARRVLEHGGARALLARNGAEALEALRANPDAADIVLMDIQMPVLDGHEAARRVRQELGLTRLPIIALTADARASERQHALRSGMDELLSKPLEPPRLFQCINRLLGERPSRDAAPPPPEQSVAGADEWPSIDGIDRFEVQARLSGDRELFQDMLARFTEAAEPPPRLDAEVTAAQLDEYRARVHRLRGSAGQLGARALFELGARIEAHCRAGEPDLARELGERFERALVDLCAAIRIHGLLPEASASPRSHTPYPLAEADPADLEPLLLLLAEQNLSALDEARRVGQHVASLLGHDTFQRFRRHLDRLEFSEAAQLLSVAPLQGRARPRTAEPPPH